MDETTNTPSGGSRKWLIIGGVVLVLIIGAFIGSRSMWWFAGVPGANIDRNLDGSTTYTSDTGTVTVGAGGSMPENWPSDAPAAYSGANIVYSGTTNPTTGEAGSAVSYTVSASPESVLEYYESRLRAEGWTIAATANAGGMRVISATKDTRAMGVYVGSDGQGTTTVTAGIQM